MSKMSQKNLTLSVIVEKDSHGYTAECRELQGCYSDGKTYEEVMKNIKEAILLHLEDRAERGDLPTGDCGQNNVSLTTLSFAVPCHVA